MPRSTRQLARNWRGGVTDAKAALKERLAKTFTSSGLFGSRAELGPDYIMQRNMGAAKGLYGNARRRGVVWRRCRGWDENRVACSFAPWPAAAGEVPWSATLYTLPDREWVRESEEPLFDRRPHQGVDPRG